MSYKTYHFWRVFVFSGQVNEVRGVRKTVCEHSVSRQVE